MSADVGVHSRKPYYPNYDQNVERPEEVVAPENQKDVNPDEMVSLNRKIWSIVSNNLPYFMYAAGFSSVMEISKFVCYSESRGYILSECTDDYMPSALFIGAALAYATWVVENRKQIFRGTFY